MELEDSSGSGCCSKNMDFTVCRAERGSQHGTETLCERKADLDQDGDRASRYKTQDIC